MNIQSIIDELGSMEYPADDVDALEQLRSTAKVVKCPVDSGVLRRYLTHQNKITVIENLANTDNPLQDASKSVIITLHPGGSFDFSDPGNLAILNAYQSAGVINETQKTEILELANKTLLPFENVSLSQLLKARGKENTKNINNWSGGGYLVVTVTDEVYEPFNPLLTRTNSYETDEPMGRSKRITKAGSHIVDLRGLVSPIEPSTITIELNAPYPFTVELR